MTEEQLKAGNEIKNRIAFLKTQKNSFNSVTSVEINTGKGSVIIDAATGTTTNPPNEVVGAGSSARAFVDDIKELYTQAIERLEEKFKNL